MWELSREVEITQKNQIGRWNKINTFEFTSRWETVEKTWRYSNRNFPVWRKECKNFEEKRREPYDLWDDWVPSREEKDRKIKGGRKANQ